jgi:starch synthase
LFETLANEFPGRVGVRIAYDNELAHKIEAGGDMFLMPSRYEPCGLNQIYSLKYGTVPVVRATGGLDDSIDQFDPVTGRGTGFKFQAYDGFALLESVRQAINVFRNEPAVWRRIQLNGMAQDFSWQASAKEYVKLYEAAWKDGIEKSITSSNISGAKSAKMSPVLPIGKGSHGR